jgi:hypothetical protein
MIMTVLAFLLIRFRLGDLGVQGYNVRLEVLQTVLLLSKLILKLMCLRLNLTLVFLEVPF